MLWNGPMVCKLCVCLGGRGGGGYKDFEDQISWFLNIFVELAVHYFCEELMACWNFFWSSVKATI